MKFDIYNETAPHPVLGIDKEESQKEIVKYVFYDNVDEKKKIYKKNKGLGDIERSITNETKQNIDEDEEKQRLHEIELMKQKHKGESKGQIEAFEEAINNRYGYDYTTNVVPGVKKFTPHKNRNEIYKRLVEQMKKKIPEKTELQEREERVRKDEPTLSKEYDFKNDDKRKAEIEELHKTIKKELLDLEQQLKDMKDTYDAKPKHTAKAKKEHNKLVESLEDDIERLISTRDHRLHMINKKYGYIIHERRMIWRRD